MDSALKYSFIVTGAIGAMLVFSGGWWPLLGTALILLGIFMAMAFGTDHDLQVYLFAALAVWALVLYGGPRGHYEANGPEPSCTAGSCWDD
jgi:hypothetical protein